MLYTMILMPAMNSALYCCTDYHTYIYIYILFDKFIGFVHTSLCFSKNMYLILSKHEYVFSNLSPVKTCVFASKQTPGCILLGKHEFNFQLQILHFLKSVLHAFMLFMSAFQKRTCPD